MPLRHQILLVSQLDRNVTEIDDVKYLCVNSGKSVEKKNKVERRNFKSMFGSKTSTTQFTEVTRLIHRKKVSRNTLSAE